MALIEGIDPRNIADAGWGLLLPADLSEEITDEIRKNLQPLLRLRRKQAGGLYREYFGPQGVLTGETKTGWLSRNGANAVGPVDPRRAPTTCSSPPRPNWSRIPSSATSTSSTPSGGCGSIPRSSGTPTRKAPPGEEGEADRPARLAVFAPHPLPGDFFTREISLRMPGAGPAASRWGTQWSVKTSLASEARLDALVNQLAGGMRRRAGRRGHSLLPAPGETPPRPRSPGARLCGLGRAGQPGRRGNVLQRRSGCHGRRF